MVAGDQKQYEKAQAEFDAWVKQNSSSGSGVSADGFFMAAARQSRITTYFGGTRTWGGVIVSGHSGVDIAAPEGTPILAARSGTVSTTADASYSNGAGEQRRQVVSLYAP